MSTLAVKEQFLTDPRASAPAWCWICAYALLSEAEEELADIHAYDALHDPAHAEFAARRFETMTSYRASRKRKVK